MKIGMSSLRGHWHGIGIVLAILLFLVLNISTLKDGHNWGGDFAHYIIHAQNLVKGNGYSQGVYPSDRLRNYFSAYSPLCVSARVSANSCSLAMGFWSGLCNAQATECTILVALVPCHVSNCQGQAREKVQQPYVFCYCCLRPGFSRSSRRYYRIYRFCSL